MTDMGDTQGSGVAYGSDEARWPDGHATLTDRNC
jgi:hypothetical protein